MSANTSEDIPPPPASPAPPNAGPNEELRKLIVGIKFQSQKEASVAVRKLCVAQRKNFGIAVSGGHNWTYRCKDWIKAKKQAAKEDKPFDESTFCQAIIPFSRRNKKGASSDGRIYEASASRTIISHTCNLDYTPTARDLLAMPSFVAAIHRNKGIKKRKLDSLMKETEGVKMPSKSAVYRARKKVVEECFAGYEDRMAVISLFAKAIMDANPGSVVELVTAPMSVGGETHTEFRSLFILLQPVWEVYKLIGRRVMGIDATNSKHPTFGGTTLTLTGQFASGRKIPLAILICDEENEANYKLMAESIKKLSPVATEFLSGRTDDWNNVSILCDRFKGTSHFMQEFPAVSPVFCGTHILDNARESRHVPAEEKSFPEQLFWDLRNSINKEEYDSNLQLMCQKYKHVAAYLDRIQHHLWVHFKLIERNCSTYGWTSCVAEPGPLDAADDDRYEDPVGIMEKFTLQSSTLLAEEIEDIVKFASQEDTLLIPYAEQQLNRVREEAMNITVTPVSGTGDMFRTKLSKNSLSEEIRNVAIKEGGPALGPGLQHATYGIPCKEAYAIYERQGLTKNLAELYKNVVSPEYLAENSRKCLGLESKLRTVVCPSVPKMPVQSLVDMVVDDDDGNRSDSSVQEVWNSIAPAPSAEKKKVGKKKPSPSSSGPSSTESPFVKIYPPSFPPMKRDRPTHGNSKTERKPKKQKTKRDAVRILQQFAQDAAKQITPLKDDDKPGPSEDERPPAITEAIVTATRPKRGQKSA
eukprot:m.141610 g.141610  ORF g.141610 m.141610 type:complete len:755 (-) comp14855_c0_seq3:75-2339(-)